MSSRGRKKTNENITHNIQIEDFNKATIEIIKQYIQADILVVTNRYEGFNFSLGEPHVLVKKDNKYGVAEIYCGLEDSPHPLFCGDKSINNFISRLPSKFHWFTKDELYELMKLNPMDLYFKFDWDEECDISDFQKECINYLNK